MRLLMLVAFIGLLFSGCTPRQAPLTGEPVSQTPPPLASETLPPTLPLVVTITPTPTRTRVPTATLAPIPEIALMDGDSYFSIDGRQQLFFSRNVAAWYLTDFNTLMKWSGEAGTKVVRIQLDNLVAGGNGYTNTGEVDEAWARNWDGVFDQAEKNGVQVLVVFSSWVPWSDPGFGGWAANPMNQKNGGPAATPYELLTKDSDTQNLWLEWVKTLVTRWQGRRNIFAWEIFSEVNLITGATQTPGVEFIERTAAVIRKNDSQHRPVTASMAHFEEWTRFYNSDAVDFINIHPYPLSAQLDRTIIADVHYWLENYDKSVIIGESGLNAESPEKYPPNAEIGVRHAVWAGVVSGSANARSLYWEDGFGIYFQTLSWSFLEKYQHLELPAYRFIEDVDFAGFEPLDIRFPPGTQVWGAAVGNETSAIGWLRDANCEPPDWNLQPVISGQTVSIVVPGSTPTWQVDFYSTQNGTDIVSSTTATRQGSSITISLPDFTDDIAFKMFTQPGSQTGPAASEAAPTTTDLIAGDWSGTIFSETHNFSALVELSIQPGCTLDQVCGMVTTPEMACQGNIVLKEIDGGTFVFLEEDITGAESCVSGGIERLELQADGTLAYAFNLTLPGGERFISNGVLERQ